MSAHVTAGDAALLPGVGGARHPGAMTDVHAPARPDRPLAHLVGSVNLPTSEDVFRAAADALGDRLPRLPDGETGDRFYWLQFQTFVFEATAGLTRVGDAPLLLRERFDQRPFALDGSVAAEDLAFPDLGYAAAAVQSFGRFSALQDAGTIPSSTRFQVSLPTPAAVVGVFFVPEVRAAVEAAYSRALYDELDRITAALPHDRIAVQWDTALEFFWIENATQEGGAQLGATQRAWWDDVEAGVISRAAQEASHVPADVPVGFHLCYGDYEGVHFAEPADTGHLASVIRGVLGAVDRPIAWFHLPVPIARDDAAYFAPLSGLEVPDGTDLVLGLVHHEDGVEGAQRRIAAAATAVPRFGIGTECGLGRRPDGTAESDLRLHAAILDAAG